MRTRRRSSPSAPATAATTSTPPSSRATAIAFAETSARERLTTSSSIASMSVSPPSASAMSIIADSAATVCSSSSRRPATDSCTRALAIATAAQPASVMTASSSASSNGPERFSARYRLPKATPSMTIGTPRNVDMGGWPIGKPYERGCLPTSSRRSGCGSRMSSPSTPCPRGRGPMRRRVSSSMPSVRKRSSSPRPSSSTPSAAYWASVRSRAISSTRCRTRSTSSVDTTSRAKSSMRRPTAPAWALSGSGPRSAPVTVPSPVPRGASAGR